MVFNKTERMGEKGKACRLSRALSLIPLDPPIGPLGILLDVQRHSEVSIMSFI